MGLVDFGWDGRGNRLGSIFQPDLGKVSNTLKNSQIGGT